MNPKFRNIDSSWITIGKTSFKEVLKELGPPMPADEALSLLKLQFSDQSLRYTTYDKKVIGLATPVVELKFSWEDTQAIYDLLIEFDSNQVVTHITESKGVALWKPFSGEASRPKPEVKRLQ